MPVPRAVRDGEICAFLGGQKRIATEYCGHLDPLDVDEYIRNGGFEAWQQAEKMNPQDILLEVKKSGLRGRGGAGFPTVLKWSFTKNAQSDQKYMVCNADEGDPGAYMDRSTLEGDPHSVLEAMTIAGYTIGAKQGLHLYPR